MCLHFVFKRLIYLISYIQNGLLTKSIPSSRGIYNSYAFSSSKKISTWNGNVLSFWLQAVSNCKSFSPAQNLKMLFNKQW